MKNDDEGLAKALPPVRACGRAHVFVSTCDTLAKLGHGEEGLLPLTRVGFTLAKLGPLPS